MAVASADADAEAVPDPEPVHDNGMHTMVSLPVAPSERCDLLDVKLVPLTCCRASDFVQHPQNYYACMHIDCHARASACRGHTSLHNPSAPTFHCGAA